MRAPYANHIGGFANRPAGTCDGGIFYYIIGLAFCQAKIPGENFLNFFLKVLDIYAPMCYTCIIGRGLREFPRRQPRQDGGMGWHLTYKTFTLPKIFQKVLDNLHQVCYNELTKRKGDMIMCKDLYIELECPFCGRTHGVAVASAEYDAWVNGKLAQNAFKSLSVVEREQLISHLCPDCQDEIFGSDEDEEWEDEDESYDYGDDDIEMGFNPYMGAYDWDC